MSLWCLLSAPLLIGCDLSALDDWTLTLLTNREAIAVNQDALGAQARRVQRNFLREVFVKRMADGSLAVGLFNRGPNLDTVNVSWDDLGISGPYHARDLWRHEDLGRFSGQISAEVAAHGVVFLRLTAA